MAVDYNRKVARKELASLLTTGLAGVVQEVLDYDAGDFEGKTAVVVVTSRAAQHPKLTMQGRNAVFKLMVISYVMYANKGEWTEEQAEDKLDDVEFAIWQTINTNTCHPQFWISMEVNNPNGFSALEWVAVGGTPYKREAITLDVRV